MESIPKVILEYNCCYTYGNKIYGEVESVEEVGLQTRVLNF